MLANDCLREREVMKKSDRKESHSALVCELVIFMLYVPCYHHCLRAPLEKHLEKNEIRMTGVSD